MHYLYVVSFRQCFRDLISFIVKAAAYYIIDYALDGVTDKQCMAWTCYSRLCLTWFNLAMVQRVQMAIALGKGWIGRHSRRS